MDSFFNLDYMPHGHCFLWQPGILWTSVVSDLLIAAAYFSIPIALFFLVKRRKDWQFRKAFILFGSFIAFCGMTHLFSILTIWHGFYGGHAILKLMTAVVSMATAVYLFANLRQILLIPSIVDMESAISKVSEEKLKRTRLEGELRAESIFKNATALIPTGLLVVDDEQKIRLANRALEHMFGYEANELTGKTIDFLLGNETKTQHSTLVANYLENPKDDYAMAAGRVVSGKKKNGDLVAVEVRLSVDVFEGKKHAFATVVDIGSFSAEQSLTREHNNRLRRAIDATNDGIWEWNVETGSVWYSQQLMKMIGRPNETPAFEHWQSHIHPDDRDRVERILADHFSGKCKYEATYRGMSESGQYEWMQTRGDTIFDQDNKPILMSGILSNIHEKKKLEQEVREKTRFLDQLLERSLTGLYIFSLKQKCNTFINPEYTRLTGYSMEDLVELQNSEGLMSLFHPDDVEHIISHFTDVVEQKHEEGESIEYRFKHKDGHWIWCYSRDSVYSFDEDGEPKEMLGAFFDISELKNREEQIRELATNFLTTFEQAAVGIAHVDFDGKFVKVNKKLCEILGYERWQLLQMSSFDVSHPDDREKSVESQRRLLDGDIEQFSMEKRYVKSSGETIWGLVTVSIVKDESTGEGHYITVIENISRRKTIELALEESNAALERFAYSASHDLQEPLRKICSFSEILEARLNEKLKDGEAIFQLKRISEASRRMSDMINSLLQLSRYSRQQLQKKTCRLSELLEIVKEDLSGLINSSSAILNLHTDCELLVEPNSFQQILRNLIVNSIHYAKPEVPAQIDFEVKVSKENVRITVKDNGRGFDASMTEQIFEPFKRLVGRDVPGTGMGLAICRQIMRAHGGTIRADALQEGAVFELVLPAVELTSEFDDTEQETGTDR